MNETQSPHPVGSSAGLASTVKPGENFCRFNLPMNTRELVWQLSNGTPCEVPRFWLNAAMKAIGQCFGNADIKVEADRKIAQLTPNRADLNDYGRRVLANAKLSHEEGEIKPMKTETTSPPDELGAAPCSALPSRIVQIASMGFCAGPNNGDCHKLIALCEDGSLWEQWHSMGYANAPTDGLWYPNHGPNDQAVGRSVGEQSRKGRPRRGGSDEGEQLSLRAELP